MLKVNGIETKILNKKFKFASYKVNNIFSGYNGYIEIEFTFLNKKGYLDFYIDTFDNKDINNYKNKKYSSVPLDNNKEVNYLEVFDTNKFYDIGDFKNKMEVTFGDIINNKISIKFKIEEEFLSILFKDKVEVEI